MADSNLQALNKLCQDLLEAPNPDIRRSAEASLAEFQSSPECLQGCMLLLDQGEVPYAPMVACNTLLKLVSARKSIVSFEQRLELSRYLLNFLGQRAPSLQPFARTSVCQLLARLTKVGWMFTPDEDALEPSYPFREPIRELMKQISADRVQESVLALEIINALVSDMNSDDGFDSLSKFRKDLAVFRDGILENFFHLSLQFLRKYVLDASKVDDSVMSLLDRLLDLAVASVDFNFLGVSDEGTEESTNIHIPGSWKSLFVDGRPADMIFELYSKLPANFSERVIHFAVQLASVRRTMLSPSHRQIYLEQILNSVQRILQNPQKLSEQGAFHQFARLVQRLKACYPMSELTSCANYNILLESLAQFTAQSLLMSELSENSIFYLLSFWSKMASAVSFTNESKRDYVRIFCPEIFKTYVESRLNNVERVISGDMDEPLDDQSAIMQTMELLAVICRVDYQKSYELLKMLIAENMNAFIVFSEKYASGKIARARLTWLLLFAGAAVFGNTLGVGGRSAEEHEKYDGELTAQCIHMMRLSDRSLIPPSPGQSTPSNGSHHMETSFIYFLDCFRRAYFVTGGKNTTVYDTLANEVQIADESDFVACMSTKITTNLQFWGLDDDLLDMTLDLFKELACGYTAVRRLLKVPEIQLLLTNHSELPFLNADVSLSLMKSRTKFYDSIARVLFTDLKEEQFDVFERFLAPFNEKMNYVISVIGGENRCTEEQIQRLIVGLCRDLRGVAIACTSKTNYQMLFDWANPVLFKIMNWVTQEWTSRPELVIPCFRLLQDLVVNRHDRLKFEMSSCTAVLLFREASTIITSFAERYDMLPRVSEDEMYSHRYKLIGSLFTSIRFTILGGYVPFGIFRLYNDNSWRNILVSFIKLAVTIPENVFSMHHKLAETYFIALESIVRNNMAFISNLEPDSFIYLLKTIHIGVTHTRTSVVSSACSALDDIVTYIYRRLSNPSGRRQSESTEPEGDRCIEAVKQQPGVLAEILNTMLTGIVFSEVPCQWSISRPLLVLVLLQEDVFKSIKKQILMTFPADRREPVEHTFENLLSNVEQNVTTKNKDAFTQNLHKFSREVVNLLKDPTGIMKNPRDARG